MTRNEKRAARRFEKAMDELQTMDDQANAKPRPVWLSLLYAKTREDRCRELGNAKLADAYRAWIDKTAQRQRDEQRRSFCAYNRSLLNEQEAEEQGIFA